jgi:hypothetical protein
MAEKPVGSHWVQVLDASGNPMPGVRALVAGGNLQKLDMRYQGDEISISPTRKAPRPQQPRKPQPRMPAKPTQSEPESPLAAERATGPEHRGLDNSLAPGGTSAQKGPQAVDYGEIADQIGSTLNQAAPQLLSIANLRAQGEIRGLLNKQRQGQKVGRDQMQTAAMRLVTAEHQAEFYGVGSSGFMDAVKELAEISDSLLQEDGRRILDAAARKGGVTRAQVQELKALDLALERQKQLLGLSDTAGLPNLTRQLNELDLTLLD